MLTSCEWQVMLDNLIHADLHPGNVLVRVEQVSWLGRLQRFLLLGQSDEYAPHIVFLDAGLAARFNAHISPHVFNFFDAIIKHDGRCEWPSAEPAGFSLTNPLTNPWMSPLTSPLTNPVDEPVSTNPSTSPWTRQPSDDLSGEPSGQPSGAPSGAPSDAPSDRHPTPS